MTWRGWRRGAAALGVGLVALASQPTIASAAPEDWAGSEALWEQASEVPNPALTAHFVRQHTQLSRLFFGTQLFATAELAKGCDTSVGPNSPTSTSATDVTTSAEGHASCNGVYDVVVTAELRTRDVNGNWTIVSDTYTLAGQIAVSAPPPQVTGLRAAKGTGRTVGLRWDDLRDATPDLAGYRIERAGSNGKWTALATTGPAATGYVDDSPPADGGDVRYRVSSQRPMADGAIATGGAQEQTATGIPAEPDPEPDPNGSGAVGSGSGGTGGSAAGAPTSRRRSPRVSAPSTRRAPSVTPTTDGGSYELELPYDDLEPGEEAAVLPDDLASDARRPGAGLLIPVAWAMVMALWAAHLRLFTRLGRPHAAAADESAPPIVIE